MAANKRLNELATAAALTATDLTIIGQGTNAFKVALSALKTLFSKITATGSPTERSLADRFGDVVNVKDHGGKGDGVVDDSSAFTSAIDELPSQGGIVLCPNGDYSATTVGSITTGSKVVRFWGYDATFPANMPGVVVTTGNLAIPMVSNNADRTGDIFNHMELGARDVTVAEYDRVFHVDGSLPDNASATTQRELIAYSYALETDHALLEGGDIRGMKGIVRANGGGSNIRSNHVIAEGLNSHTGDLTAILASVFRSDETDGVNNPIGQSCAVVGQVGAGCLGVFEARARGADQRPDFAYRVRGGANALKPEIACFQMHGGGNGAFFRGLRDEDSSDVIYNVDNKARTMAPSVYSGRRTIGDDAIITITTPEAVGSAGMIVVWSVSGDSQVSGMGFYIVSGTARMQEGFSGTALDFVTITLTGTDGVDGRVSVGAVNDGTIVIENRLGGSKDIGWFFIAASSVTGQLS